MSLTAAIIRELVAAGLDGEALVAAVERIEASSTPGKERSKAAERTERWRQNKAAKASQTVTSDVTESVTGDVTDRHQTSPLARVEDNLLPSKKESKKEVSKEERDARASAHGTRLAEEWNPNDRDWSRALDLLGGDAPAVRELDRFRDYWRAVPGAKGRKLCWDSTWRGWISRTAEQRPNLKVINGSDPPRSESTRNNDRAFAGAQATIARRRAERGE